MLEGCDVCDVCEECGGREVCEGDKGDEGRGVRTRSFRRVIRGVVMIVGSERKAEWAEGRVVRVKGCLGLVCP